MSNEITYILGGLAGAGSLTIIIYGLRELRRRDKETEKKDQQIVNNIAKLIENVPEEHRDTVSEMLKEASKMIGPYRLEQLLKDYQTSSNEALK